MKPAISFAKYIYDQGFTSNLQIQKLLYVAFGFYGVDYGKFLFEDPIEAWKWGPVIPSVYFAIKKPQKGFCDIKPILEKEQEETLSLVLEIYGRKAPSLLVELTHKDNTPWSRVYVEGVKHAEIDKQSVIDCYKDFLAPVNSAVEIMIQEDFREVMRRLAET